MKKQSMTENININNYFWVLVRQWTAVVMTLEYCTYMYIYPLQLLTIIYWSMVSMHLMSYGGTQEVAKQERSLQVE